MGSCQSKRINPPVQDTIFDLWNTLADYPAARTGNALAHLFRVVLPLIGAQHGFWCLLMRMATDDTAQRDPSLGWRVREVILAEPNPDRVARLREFMQAAEKQNQLHLDEATTRLMRRGGEFRAARLSGGVLVDFDRFQQTDHYRHYYAKNGIDDRLWVSCPVNADIESGFVFDRFGHSGPPHFDDAEMALIGSTLRGLRWFHRRLVLNRGVSAGKTPCSPAEHRTLSLLLTGQSEKEISDLLGLSVRTTHNSVTAIFKKLGVRSRAELMALWL